MRIPFRNALWLAGHLPADAEGPAAKPRHFRQSEHRAPTVILGWDDPLIPSWRRSSFHPPSLLMLNQESTKIVSRIDKGTSSKLAPK